MHGAAVRASCLAAERGPAGWTSLRRRSTAADRAASSGFGASCRDRGFHSGAIRLPRGTVRETQPSTASTAQESCSGLRRGQLRLELQEPMQRPGAPTYGPCGHRRRKPPVSHVPGPARPGTARLQGAVVPRAVPPRRRQHPSEPRSDVDRDGIADEFPPVPPLRDALRGLRPVDLKPLRALEVAEVRRYLPTFAPTTIRWLRISLLSSSITPPAPRPRLPLRLVPAGRLRGAARRELPRQRSSPTAASLGSASRRR
ncbi:hypothetical protein AMOR_18220 [Anaeromyxobacter oryzae]|uniref:Uncharacterized protein n=1 Tax=Anaeromyxobacter oryzae TaxID=2918170 RepID=A0ABM7WTJ9_9BACT|nr:hypothetical protein AMOR_18220 [Anaeromyxobacter oryzae]